MSLAATELRRFGLAKETVRGTVETTPTKWYPVLKDSELTYDLAHLKDEALRGILETYPDVAGPKNGTGKIKMPLDAQTCGEFFYSLLGAKAAVQQAATTAYKHTFTVDGSSIQRPAYTFFMDRGGSVGVLKYNLGVVNKIVLSGPVDNLVNFEADVFFKTEASGAIGSPAFPTQRYLSFAHSSVKIGGSTDSNVKSWQLAIDGGSRVHRTLTTSADISDVLVKDNVMITGNLVIFFDALTERAKFLANTTNSIEFIMTHTDDADTGYKYSVDITLPKCQYHAYPFGDEDGLLAAKVDFEAKYDTGTSKAITVDVINKDVSY